MTSTSPPDSLAERALLFLSLVVFWAAFLCLAAGLALWLAAPTLPAAGGLLTAGFVGLLGLPLLRLASALSSSFVRGDWLALAATLAVLALLFALTLRDTVTHW